MIADVLERIVAARKARVAATGRAQGIDLPPEREAPIVPFPHPVMCEVKRRSPSRGDLAAGIDPVAHAGRYRAAGAGAVSVLTEEEFFAGSLADLVAVKTAYPDLGVLRKDFLLDTEDIVVSWRAGADAVLLIAAILSPETLGAMLLEARRLGIAALVEIHDEGDVAAVRPFQPALIGINSRDLRTFRVDLLGPLAVAEAIDWQCTRVFESGIFHREDVMVARDGGFGAVLVGEAVVKDPARVVEITGAMEDATAGGGTRDRRSSFWPILAVRRGTGARYRPLVKICGITNIDDARAAVRYGADVLGLIYARSPRTAPEGLAEELGRGGIEVPLVGVVVEGNPDNADLLRRGQADLSAGLLSALQLHGASRPGEAIGYGWPVYRAVAFRSVAAVGEVLPAIRTPRVLVDAFHPSVEGGTGEQVDEPVLDEVVRVLGERPHGALWLAGGLNPVTVYTAVADRRPELIDASSGLESEPGRKSHTLLRRYFEAVNDAAAEREER